MKPHYCRDRRIHSDHRSILESISISSGEPASVLLTAYLWEDADLFPSPSPLNWFGLLSLPCFFKVYFPSFVQLLAFDYSSRIGTCTRTHTHSGTQRESSARIYTKECAVYVCVSVLHNEPSS